MGKHLAAVGRTDEYGTLHVELEDLLAEGAEQRVMQHLADASPSYLASKVIAIREALEAPGDINGDVHDLIRQLSAVTHQGEVPSHVEGLIYSAIDMLAAIVKAAR